MAKHIDLNNPDIMTSKDAALRWGKAPDYVRQVLRSNPGRFPEGSVRTFARQILVTREGMEAVTGHGEIVKK
ncbi:MAG TPA: hypothetical protein H9875_00415 [Candidatus Levilactobacillus faecigallinarum]|uniref:Helix-turn-helix domain-containing protein n=1 Tax=Candidatus Levilactobacillus faecigallinarum TaxID=2838638 RepID=A0A9D1U3X3_9LACO|nr:hypothetical protein [Candidatus Levilactobacillus faecigallinarum]